MKIKDKMDSITNVPTFMVRHFIPGGGHHGKQLDYGRLQRKNRFR